MPDKVVVRMWEPKNIVGSLEPRVGHISLELYQGVQRTYISFWPPVEGNNERYNLNTLAEDKANEKVKFASDINDKHEVQKILQANPSLTFDELTKDLEGKPNIVEEIDFLDASKIKEEYKRLIALDDLSYVFRSRANDQSIEANCAVFVQILLMAGGLQEFLPERSPSLSKFFSNPEERRSLADYLRGDIGTTPMKIISMIRTARQRRDGIVDAPLSTDEGHKAVKKALIEQAKSEIMRNITSARQGVINRLTFS